MDDEISKRSPVRGQILFNFNGSDLRVLPLCWRLGLFCCILYVDSITHCCRDYESMKEHLPHRELGMFSCLQRTWCISLPAHAL